MRIAVVGGGIAGLTAAYALSRRHEVTVFEAEPRLGGHTHTVDVERPDRRWPVDTGFIVFNRVTYPNFVRLLEELGVGWRDSDMSFSVACERTGLEFSPSTLRGLYGHWRNIARPGLWRLPFEVMRFRRESAALLTAEPDPELTLGRFLHTHGFSRFFRNLFLVPMGAAIWSADPALFARIPAAFFARFFANHGFLELEQPRWLTVQGGSRSYLEPLTRPFRDRIRLATQVTRVRRTGGAIHLTAGDREETFDQVVLACHSDQARHLLADPSPAEADILAALPYQENEVVLHTDDTILPHRRAAWASWNYRLPGATPPGRASHHQPHAAEPPPAGVILTYAMNRLQGLAADVQFCVTLNATPRLQHTRIIRTFRYAHPVFTPAGIRAQRRWEEINGVRRTWYAGAWWRYGFHEDGTISGLRVARALGCPWP